MLTRQGMSLWVTRGTLAGGQRHPNENQAPGLPNVKGSF